MYEDLVRRLNAYSAEHECHGGITAEAADAIEKLDTLLDGVSADNEALCETIEMLKKQVFDMSSLIRDYSEQTCWIPVTERLPEECEDLDLHEDMMIRFTSVWCCDANTGTINVRNRFQHKITGIQFLDQNIQDTDWHWSNSWWEPTHWMPIAPLPEPSKEETK